jgi:hypothetical protein
MRSTIPWWLCNAALLACVAPGPQPPAAPHFDLVVYDATPAGIAAAVQAERMGLEALVLSPHEHLGGLTTSGLGATDIGNKAAIGGIAREFYSAVKQHYASEEAWTRQGREEFRGRGHRSEEDAAWTFEPHVAEDLIEALVAKEGVEVWRGVRLDRAGALIRSSEEPARLRGVPLVWGQGSGGAPIVTGEMFIDASYEGDLMAMAGVPFTVGREANADHAESLDGVQLARATKHQFELAVDPYLVPGQPESGLLPGIEAGPAEPDGSADHRVQAYCFRMCLTDDPQNRLPWEQPEGYDASEFELLLRWFDAGEQRAPWHVVKMPNRKSDVNNNRAVSTDFLGGSHRWPEASDAERTVLYAEHRRWQEGLLWTLASNPRVPEKVREEVNRWGRAADEFSDHDGWPWRLYVREGRRMVSDLVMSEAHCLGERVAADPVGLAAYTMDSHNVRRVVVQTPTGAVVRNEGDVQVGGFEPYPIGFAAIVPPRGSCTNLLVPVCLSATHIAFGSIRMEPVYFVLGQSAATIAAHALEEGVAVQDVNRSRLRERLLEDRQVLEWSR